MNLPIHGGLRPHRGRGVHFQAPDTIGLNPPGQLIVGYNWLALLNQDRKQSMIQSSESPIH